MDKPDKSISVAVKIRPLIARERANNQSSQWVTKNQNYISQLDGATGMFFDNIFTEDSNTQELFDSVVQPIVVSALKGINGTVFAYGQTSSGKTYTMIGEDNEPGIVVMAVRQVFKEIEASKDREFLLRVGYFEIYNEKIYDLLEQSNIELKLHDTKHGETNIAGLHEVIAASEDDIMMHFEAGNKMKRFGETAMNERSSRSHAIFRITIESQLRKKEGVKDETATKISILNLVDLAGSERAHMTKATGNRLKEGSHINKSLLSLGLVIQKLSETSSERDSGSDIFINYRDSKLTRILQASLGGNALATIICAVTPAAIEETLSTLNFGQRAKCIKNRPKVNEELSDSVMMIRMKQEISRLQTELQTLEYTKNHEFEKVLEIQKKIFERERQFLVSHSHPLIENHLNGTKDVRRKTWCPTSVVTTHKSQIPQPQTKSHHSDNFLRPPVPIFVQSRDDPLPLSKDFEETFIPGENWKLDRTLSPTNEIEIHTPKFLRKRSSSFGTPNPLLPCDYQKKCLELERQLQELQDFTLLEAKLNVYDESYDFKLKEYKEQLFENEVIRIELQKKVDELEEKASTVDDLETKFKEMEISLKAATIQRAKALADKELAENSLSSTQYEFDLAKVKFKSKEKELIDTLEEARNESKIKSVDEKYKALQESMRMIEAENLKLQKQLDEATLALQNYQDLVIAKDQDIDQLEKGIKEFARNVRDNEELIQKLTTENTFQEKSYCAEILNYKLQIESLSTPKPSTDANTSAISIQNDDLQGKIDELELLLISHKEDNSNLKSLNDKLNEKIKSDQNEKQAEINRIQSENDELSMQVVDNAEECDSLKNKLEELKKTILEGQLIVEKLTFVEQSLATMNDGTNLLESDKFKDDDLIKKLYDLINQSHQLKTQYSVNEAENLLKIESLEAELAKLKELEGDAQRVLEQLKSEVDSNSNQIADAKQENDTLLLNIQKLETEKIQLLEEIKSFNINDIETHKHNAINLQHQINEFENEITDLKAEIKKKDEKLLDLEESFLAREVDLSTEVDELKAGLVKIMALEQENEKLKSTEKEIESFKETFKQIEKDLREKADELIERDDQISELNRMLDNKSSKIEELENEIQEKMSDNLQIRTELETNQEASLRAAKELKELQTEISKIDRNDENESSRIEKIFELEILTDELKAQLQEALSRTRRDTNEAFNELAKIADLEDKLNDLDSLKALESEKFSIKIHDLETQLCECLDQLESSNKKALELEHKLSLTNETDSDELMSTKQLCADLEQRLAESQLELDTLNLKSIEVNESLKCEVESLKQELLIKKEAVLVLEKQIEDRDDQKLELIELQNKLGELNQHIQDKNTEIINMKDEKDQKEQEMIESLTMELNTLKGELVVKEESVEALKLNIELLNQKMSLQVETSDTLKMELDDAQNSVDTMKTELLYLHELKDLSEKKDVEIEKLQFNLEELNLEIHSKNAEIFKLRDEKDNKNTENLALKKSIEKFQEHETQSKDSADKLKQLTNQIQFMESTNEDLTQKLIEMNETNEIAKEKLIELENYERDLSASNAQIINNQSKLLLQEEKIKQLEQQVLEVNDLLLAKTADCEDLKSRYRRRSSDSEKKLSDMEIKLNDIMQENGALGYEKASLEADLKNLKNKLHFAQDKSPNQAKELERLQKYKDQMDYDATVLEEKLIQITDKFDKAVLENNELTKKLAELSNSSEQQSSAECVKLQQEIDAMTTKIKLQTSENFVHTNKIAKLQELNNDLNHQLKEIKGMHLFKNKQQMNELDVLKEQLLDMEKELQNSKTNGNNYQIIQEFERKHFELTRERDDLAKKVNELSKRSNAPLTATPKLQNEQKSKRLSMHDEHRRLSLWGQTKEFSMQTDPTDVNCNCIEMNEKVVNLTREVKQKECRIRTLERMNMNHPLEVDLIDCKRLLNREQEETNRLRHQIESSIGLIKNYKEKITNLERKQIIQPMKMNPKIEMYAVSTQTNNTISMESDGDFGIHMKVQHDQLLKSFTIMQGKYEATKKVARSRNERIADLERQVNKENQSNNRTPLANSFHVDQKAFESEINMLKMQINEWEEKYQKKQATESIVSDKYNQAKQICKLRLADIEKLEKKVDELQKQIVKLTESHAQLQSKYEQAKNVCILRKEKIERLEGAMPPTV